MLILDTDHFSELLRGSAIGVVLEQRLVHSGRQPVTTIITIEEQSRGWLARIKRAGTRDERIHAYQRYQHMTLVAGAWTVLPWDAPAADNFERLVALRTRIGRADLMIASIALAHRRTLLTRNLRDFGRVPDLDVHDWLN